MNSFKTNGRPSPNGLVHNFKAGLKVCSGIAFIVAFTYATLFFYKKTEGFKHDFSSEHPQTQILFKLIEHDFKNLQAQKYLPAQLYDIKDIQYLNRSENFSLKNQNTLSFTDLKQKGKFRLIVEIYPFPEEEQSHLVQFNWIDLKSKDKVWEMNRVYKLGATNHKNKKEKTVEAQKKPDHF